MTRGAQGESRTITGAASFTDGVARVFQRLIDVLMTPGGVLCKWIASFDRAGALRLQPITLSETRIICVPPGEVDTVEEAVR